MQSLLNITALSKRLTGNFAGRQSKILTFNFQWVCPAQLNGWSKLIPPYTPLSLIPKKLLKPLKWCIIHDLSWLAGHSINDSIPKDLFSCTYNTLDTAIARRKSFGQAALMSKLDLLDAFCHILVHPADWELLGS